jgi:hypothetical protein
MRAAKIAGWASGHARSLIPPRVKRNGPERWAGAKVKEVSNEGPTLSIGQLQFDAPFVSSFAFLQKFRDKPADFSGASPESHWCPEEIKSADGQARLSSVYGRSAALE